jgi:hypothetical protein
MEMVRIEKTNLIETWINVKCSQRVYFDRNDKKIGFNSNNGEYSIQELLSIINYAQKLFNVNYENLDNYNNIEWRKFKNELL